MFIALFKNFMCVTMMVFNVWVNLAEELHVMSFHLLCDSSLLWLLVVSVLQWYKTDINNLIGW